MGLTSWKSEVVRKTDVTTAKNYLKEEEIDGLSLIVGMWLDYAERQAKQRQQVFMKDWQDKLNAFLEFNEYKILEDKGKISKAEADQKALNEYKEYNKHQPIQSDFDKQIKKYLESGSSDS